MNKKKRPSHVERVANVLADDQWHTSDELYHRTRSIVHSRIADLRRRGWEIEHQRVEGTNDARHHRYRVTRRPA